MSDTPETDKAERMVFAQEYIIPTEFARKLERERDELREEIDDKTSARVLAAKFGIDPLTEEEHRKNLVVAGLRFCGGRRARNEN